MAPVNSLFYTIFPFLVLLDVRVEEGDVDLDLDLDIEGLGGTSEITRSPSPPLMRLAPPAATPAL